MNGRRTLPWVILLALVSVGGIVGLLLSSGIWDWPFMILAALPLEHGPLVRLREHVHYGITSASGPAGASC